MAPNSVTSVTSAKLVFTNLQKFVNLWKSGNEGSFKVDCKDGKAKLIFSCNLGNPDDHIQDGRHRKRRRVKSENRKARDNARATAFQAARASPPTAASPAPTPAGQAMPIPVPSVLPPAEQDQDKSPPQSLQLTPPSSSHQPPPRHTSPLPDSSSSTSTLLTSSPPSSPGETSQEEDAEGDGTRSLTRSVRFSEETGEKETMAPRGAENATEEEVASSQRSPSSHQGQEAVEPEEVDVREDGVPAPSFFQLQLDLYSKRVEDWRRLREANSPESVKPPEEINPPPLKRT